ncbi:MAG: FtsW/RodA/SpoVE family cell cycle protein [Anaerolineae bacterium]
MSRSLNTAQSDRSLRGVSGEAAHASTRSLNTQPINLLGLQLPFGGRTAGALLFALAALFVGTGAVTLHLAPFPRGLESWQLIVMVGGWIVAWVGSYIVLDRRLADFDPLIVAFTAMLTGWGLLLQARLAPALLVKQVIWLLLGAAAMCTVASVPTLTRMLRRYRYTILTAGLVLLGATLVFGVNPSGFGQELWLGAFGIYLQPSEPLKLLLVIYLAAYLADKREMPSASGEGQPIWMAVLGPMAAMVGVALLLLGWQQDLGAALLFYLTFVTMVYLAWGKAWYVALGLVLFIPVALLGTYLSSRVALRVSIWLDPWAPEQADRAFQILQSLFAFGAGGLFGEGLGQGSPGLIPAVHTDFVYAAIVEEFGLVGALSFIFLVAAYAYRGIRAAQNAESAFEALLGGGIAALVAVQTWVIAGGNAKMIPITGVTLPFMSYGGSSLVTMLGATGLLLNLSAPHPPPLTLSLNPQTQPSVQGSAVRLGRALLLLLSSLAVVSGSWSILRAAELQQYPTNPRYILSEARIRRGKILDRNAEVLADIEIDDEGYVTRTYPVPEAAPVVGFATFEYGTDGIEAVCADRLRGEVDQTPRSALEQQLLHRDPVGRDVRLTIDSRVQRRAQQLIEGTAGAAVVLDTHSGEILALASSPIYDPATVAERWAELRQAPNSPFLNRATQGLAQPGTVLQPLLLTSAWQINPGLSPAEPISRPVSLDGMTWTCAAQPAQATWQSALASACPYPFIAIAEDMDDETFTRVLETWGLLDPPAVTLPTVAADLEPANLSPTVEALGQGDLLVTPLQMAGAVAVLGNDGVRPPLQLLPSPLEGCVIPRAEAAEGERVIDAEAVDQILSSLPRFDGAAGHLGTSLAGPDRHQAWFVGLNSPSLPRYGVVVFIDQVDRPQRAAEIGTELLRWVLEIQR